MKNKTRVSIFITIFLFISLSLTMYNIAYKGKTFAADNAMVGIDELLDKSGCKWFQTDISSWGKTTSEGMTIGDLEDIAIGAGEFFNLEDKLELSTSNDLHTKKVNLTGNDKKGLKYEIIVTKDKELHIIVNILNNHSFIDTDIITDEIKKYFQSIQMSPNVYTTLTGTFEGELDTGRRKAIVERLIRDLRGRGSQIMEERGLISIAGYSPVIDIVPMDDINFQIASRYNSYRDKTFLWIATPIITVEY